MNNIGVVNMDFRQLESFVAIAKFKSFSKAAERLYLTQPTVSNHIQNLEKELGTILLNRFNKKITLTNAGEILYCYALEMINKRELALFSLESFKGKIEGLLEIACSTIPEQYVLPEIIKSFSDLYPSVQYSLCHYDSQQVIDSILEGIIDFGFVGAKDEVHHLNYIDIMDDKLVFIAPNSNEFQSVHTVNIDFILNQKIIVREKGSGTRKIFEQLLFENHINIDHLNIIASLENTEAIKQFVCKGLGITLISELAVKDEIKCGLVKKLEFNKEIKRNFYFVYHRSRALSPLAETFKDFVLKDKTNPQMSSQDPK